MLLSASATASAGRDVLARRAYAKFACLGDAAVWAANFNSGTVLRSTHAERGGVGRGIRSHTYRCGLTVIVNLAVAVFPLLSVAEHLTTVRPILKRLPDLGRHDTGTAPSTSSRAVTL